MPLQLEMNEVLTFKRISDRYRLIIISSFLYNSAVCFLNYANQFEFWYLPFECHLDLDMDISDISSEDI